MNRTTRMFRITRLLRVFRVVRVVRFIRALRTLVYSVLCTLKSLVWALLLLLILVYIFGLLFGQAAIERLTLITEGEDPIIGALDPKVRAAFLDRSVHCSLEIPEEDERMRSACALYSAWGSLSRSMYTLFETITGGLDWHDSVMALTDVGWPYVGVFTGYIAFAYFCVLNVVTGVFCQSAMESAQHDAELAIQSHIQHKKKYSERIRSLFSELDTDGSGALSVQEFKQHLNDPAVEACFATLDLDAADAWTLFQMLDTEDAGEIDIDQFVMGCLRIKGNAKSIDMAKLMSDSNVVLSQLRAIRRMLGDQERTVVVR
eukprot:gnl/TRDRNA2_/TRDRNA2_163048_c0_seq1.p1 gnl/TRDRNA2_/TRDRNA2_163048_c0~~gnl/TRDRNA2_/TRDRNA2_163048_c0_seq1.p1  ORF type:complete len:317 (+),score=47.48 gnl/TRDRNA2_/TRDRNA2_163048_c0_seq1:2-952(+)